MFKYAALVFFSFALKFTCWGQKELSSTKTIPVQNSRSAAGRKAFICGNANYKFIRNLSNSLNDVSKMEAALKSLNFNTTPVSDFRRSDFLNSFQRFVQSLNQSDTVVIYYSGHGASVGRENFLIPSDASFKCAEDLVNNSMTLSSILIALKNKNIKNGLVILDACRNLPLSICNTSAGFSQGFNRPLDNLDGNLVVFAAREGETADDNIYNTTNSVFTHSLLKYITQNNLSISQIIDKTRLDVINVTNDKQHPKVYSDLQNHNLIYRGQPSRFTIPTTVPKVVKKEENEMPGSTLQCPLCLKHKQILVEYEDGIWGYYFYSSLKPKNPFIVSRIAGREYKDSEQDIINQLYRYKAYGKFSD